MKAGPEPSWVGALVGGKYRVVRLLAKGGMGVVYEAQHAIVRRRFAIKFLRRALAERRDILTRFQREAEAAGALENDNVAAAVDFGISDDGTPYIVMEYLVGEDLASLLEREGRLPISRAADLAAQACRGVGAAHAAGIVHRDLKPHNLFVSRRDDGTDLVKVLDFGVAKLHAIDESSASTRTGMVLGTAAYMSPEQARGEKTIDQRADLYALGAILYELLSLRRPHPGESQNAILHHVATQQPVPLESVQPDLPAALVDAVGRALASDAAARPPSAEAFAQSIAPFGRREVWAAPPTDSSGVRASELSSTMLANGDSGRGTPAVPTADDRVPNLARSTPAVRAPAPSSPPRPRRPRTRVVAASAALALVTFIVAAGVLRRAVSSKTDHSVQRSEAVGPATANQPAIQVVPSLRLPDPAVAGANGVGHSVPSAGVAPIPPASSPEMEPKARSHRTSASVGAPPPNVRPGLSGRPDAKSVGRPDGHAGRRSVGAVQAVDVSNPPVTTPLHAEKPGATPPTFDPNNPYR
jgi:serine/threonine protein kinase